MRPSRSQPLSQSGTTTGTFMSPAFSQAWPRPSVQTKCVVSIRSVSIIFAPMRSTVACRSSRSCWGMMPGVMVIPVRSVILWVRTVKRSLVYVPAEVRRTRWKVYSLSTARPEIFVLSLSRGMLPALLPLRYRLRLRSSAVASCTGSHSSTTEVCVALRQRSTGADGEWIPKVE